tara:strand:- start:796 stop:1449 length:654 start_codon:yes stop_codon:yes gene_type:complete
LSKFASGKRAYGISDRSGFRYRLKDMKKEWNGLLVGKDEFEPKHPQLFVKRRIIDPQAIRDARPEINLVEERTIQWGFNPVGTPTKDYSPPNNMQAQAQVGTVTVLASGVGVNQTVYTVTVASFDGSNRYYIDGVRQPTLNLNEGDIYLFNWSSASSHPLRFSTTSDGTHNSGSEYTTGVVKDDSSYTTQITVAVGAPTLYYYCSNHSGMGGQANTP